MKNTCKSCNSTNLIEGLTIADQSHYGKFKLSIDLETDPSGVIFRGTKSHNLIASVCTDCGSVDLKIKNPKRFKEDYLKSKNKK